MGVADTVMAGRYSATDMAAVAIGFSITMPLLFFTQGIILALPPIISRFNGAKQIDKVANATHQIMWLGLIFAFAVVCLSLVVPAIFAQMDMQEDLRNITVEYVQYICYSAPFFALYQVLRNFCEGLSVTKPSMVIMFVGLMVNIPANYLLIYGQFGFPEMGGAGCGLATGLVFVAMFIATAIYILAAKTLHQYQLFSLLHRPNLAQMYASLKLGLPIAMTIFFEVTLFGAVALLLAPFGANVVASHQIALNFSAIMFMLPLSIGMATCIRVGFLLGEGKPQQAKYSVYAALLCATAISLFTATCTILLRTFIASQYTTEIDVIQLAASLMLFAAMFQFSDAIQVVCAQSLRGYKDTTAMFLITFFSYWIVGLPIGSLLGLTDWIVPKMSAAGLWIGIICGLTTAAVLLSVRLKIVQNRLKHSAA